MKGTFLANVIVLGSKTCTHFGLASLFYLILSNNVRKRFEAANDLEFYFYFPGQRFRTTT